MEINGQNRLDPNVFTNANQALNRISTGIELNQSSNDPAALAISNNLIAQSNAYSQAVENTNSAVALTQIADGALQGQSTILDNVREDLIQASTDTTSQEGREALLNDIQDLLTQFNDIANQTNFNGQTLLQNSSSDNTQSQTLQFQAGTEDGNIIETTGVQSNTTGLGLDDLLNQDVSTFTSEDARNFLSDVDDAINNLNDIRSEFASVQNQLSSSTRNLLTQETQTLGANAVYDTDFAQESANFSKQNILAQIGAFGLAQSNNINQQTVSRLLT